MEFNVNHPIIFLIVGIIIAVVLAQSVFFLVKALKRAKEIGMETKKLKRIIISAAIFTVAPAVAIVVSVIALSKDLGIALPWLRLSVVGSMSYETIAATNALSGMGLEFGKIANLDAKQYVTIAFVMTISIMVGIWLVPLLCKKMKTGLINMKNKDAKWLDIFQSSMFIGMISAFVGFVFCDFSGVFKGDTTGLIPVLVMAVSALTMLLAGALMKITKARWINDYALPISLIAGMASAIPITAWLG
ncbi:MAG: DUF5058 family protein [Acutalibacteraceae bacterium]|nr:DUF5058 family protein [Acutalibacteraceae bacterium]